MKVEGYPEAALPGKFVGRPYCTKPWEVSWLIWKARSVPGNILEIGAYKGETTLELASAFPKKRIFCVDNGGASFPQHYHDFKPVQLARHLKNVTLIEKDSKDLKWDELKDISFAFIDGDHTMKGVRADTELVLKNMLNGVIVWHDYYWHPDHGVYNYVTNLSKSYPGITHVLSTGIAYCDL